MAHCILSLGLTGSLLRSLSSDLRLALRQLRRSAGFAVLVLVTLTLGIGLTTAVYSLVDGVLLRPFPLPQPEELVAAHTVVRDASGQSWWADTSWPNLRDWQIRNHTFRGLAGIIPDYRLVSGSDAAGGAVIPVNRVSTNYFGVLGVRPLIGRDFVSSDERAGNHVAIVSYGLWQRIFGSDQKVLGQTILISNEAYSVIGVMPQGFVEPRNETAEVWTSIGFLLEGSLPRATVRNDPMAEIVGRLNSGVTMTAAQADLSALQAGLAASFPEIRYQNAVAVESELDEVAGYMRGPLYLLFASVMAVLLLVCANASGLILTRAMKRRADAALRNALGATQWRIGRQLLSEGAVLGGCAGLLGAGLAWWLLRMMLPLVPHDIPREAELSLSWRVLCFAAATSLFCAIVSSVLPAWRLARTAPMSALREGQHATAGQRTRWLQDTMVVIQTAIGVALMFASGFLIRGFVNLRNVNTGFRSDHLFTFNLPLTEARYPHTTRAFFYHELLAKLAAIPGVRSASGGYPLPTLGWGTSTTVEVDGRPNPPGNDLDTIVGVAEPGFFETLGIPLRRGRLFSLADDAPQRLLVAVVNETFAKRYFRDEDPVGHHIRPDIREIRNQATAVDPLGNAEREIVGVIADTVQDSLTQHPEPFVVFPFAQAAELMRPRLVMRVVGDPMQYEKIATHIVKEIDPNLFLMEPRSMEMQLAVATGTQRFETLLIGGFSGIALFLTSLGFYSMLAAMVASRTREIGVRMAIGADRTDIAWIVLVRVTGLLFVGAATGTMVAAVAWQVVNSSDAAHDLLFGVSWADTRVLASFVPVLALVAMFGCIVPVWRAIRIDPIQALRDE
jgi:putative ABC transport system permease protein